MERAYNYHELLNCTNKLNLLSAIEYGSYGLQFGQSHNKQENIWTTLHPRHLGETAADLSNYSGVNELRV
jgi:hypothetical protein